MDISPPHYAEPFKSAGRHLHGLHSCAVLERYHTRFAARSTQTSRPAENARNAVNRHFPQEKAGVIRFHCEPDFGSTSFSRPHFSNNLSDRLKQFQDIFALSLPDRKDRRLPLIRAANATNITITILDAVRDEQIPKEKIPEGWGVDGHEPKRGEIGCLRSHVMTWEKSVPTQAPWEDY